MKHYKMYKSIMKYLTDKDLSLNASGCIINSVGECKITTLFFFNKITELSLIVV